MDQVTIEELEVNPNKKLTDSTRKILIEIIENEFNVQSTMYDNQIRERRTAIMDAYKQTVGFAKLIKAHKKALVAVDQAVDDLNTAGLDICGNLFRRGHYDKKNDIGEERANLVQVQLDNVQEEVKPANNLKNKIIARMALADSHGEAFVILRQTLGNGVIPSMSRKQLEAPTA